MSAPSAPPPFEPPPLARAQPAQEAAWAASALAPPEVSPLFRWFLPHPDADPDLLRRAQLLLAICSATVVLALFFVFQAGRPDAPLTPLALALLSLTAFVVANPILLRVTGSPRLPGTLLCLELLAAVAIIAFIGDGLRSPVFLWNLMIPWIGAILVGPWLGFVCAGLLVLETLAFFLLDQLDLLHSTGPMPFEQEWFWLLCVVEMVTCVALLAWIHESQNVRNIRLANEQLRKAHQALAQSEARFRSLVQHSSDVIALLDEQGTLRYLSASVERLLGFAPAVLQRLPLLGLVHPDDRLAVQRLSALLVEDPGPQQPDTLTIPAFRMRCRDGGWRWMEATVTNLLQAPEVQALVVHLRDVTERKSTEEQLVMAREAAENLARTKTAFLTNMSHEIRTPLTSIIGFAQVLEQELNTDYVEFAHFIQRSGQRLLDTLNSILDLAQLESGEVSARNTTVDAVAEVEDAVALLQPLAREKGLVLEADLPEGSLPATLDASFLHRILTNLIGNAIKFTAAGSIVVSVKAVGAHLQFQVCDTGTGIAPDFLPHLFAEFKQESTGLARRHEGTGLGLAITRRLTTLMGGHIAVASQLGQGSTFTVVLPRGAGAPGGDGAAGRYDEALMP